MRKGRTIADYAAKYTPTFFKVANWLFRSIYKGAEWSEKRSQQTWWHQNRDAHLDLDHATRDELVKKSRDLERNNAIVNKLCDLFEQYVVGPNGLQISSASSDTKWNGAAQEWWNEWQNFCDLTSLLHFSTIQSIAARTWFVDGEVFILKTRGNKQVQESEGVSFRPRIQLIESHRVATPPEFYDREGKSIIDGIEIDERGRPVRYWIQEGDKYVPRDASQVIHIFEPHRPGQYRGIPFVTPVINDIIDLQDLQGFEMDRAKDCTRFSNVFKTASGEMPAAALRRSIVNNGAATDGTAGGSSAERTKYIADVTRVTTIAIKKDEELQQPRTENPSVAVQQYWDYLTSRICAGVGISKLLVFPHSLQGTVARANLDIDAAFFQARSAVLQTAFIAVRNYAVGWAKVNDKRLVDPPGDWFKCTTRAPKSPNVDVGKNSNAMLSELKAGATTFEDIYSPQGKDWKERLTQRAEEVAFIKLAALAASIKYQVEVTPAEVSEFAVAEIAEEETEETPTGEEEQITEDKRQKLKALSNAMREAMDLAESCGLSYADVAEKLQRIKA